VKHQSASSRADGDGWPYRNILVERIALTEQSNLHDSLSTISFDTISLQVAKNRKRIPVK
jgi:hypothetical protein